MSNAAVYKAIMPSAGWSCLLVRSINKKVQLLFMMVAVARFSFIHSF